MDSVAVFYLSSIAVLAFILIGAFLCSPTFDDALETCRKSITSMNAR